jgi:NTE family protein
MRAMGLADLLIPRRRRGVVLALGGGGARGLAHVGVLSVLEESGVPVRGIAGTSAGAVVGAMWLALGSAAAVRRRWEELLASGLLPPIPDVRLTDDISSRDNLLLQFARKVQQGATVALALGRRSLITAAGFDRALAFLIPDLVIEELPLPFAAVTTDFATGRPVAVTTGSLRFAVAASSAIPGVLPPYLIDGKALVDGGVVADVPVLEAQALAPTPVLAVATGEAPDAADPQTITVPRAMLRAGLMTHEALRARILAAADMSMRPDVAAIHWSEFTRTAEAVAAGRAAAEARLPEIRKLGRRRRARRMRGV